MRRGEKHIYKFGPFSLDPTTYTLMREGTEVLLRRRAFAVLLYLIEKHGQLVRRDELLEAIWPGTVVQRANVTVVIHELKKVLGEEAIQTIRNEGYRLVVGVEIIVVTNTDQDENGTGSQLLSDEGSGKNSQRSRLLRVFLCHSSNDKPAVRQLYRRLKRDGIDPWLDEENLLPGQDWQHEIPKAVRGNDVVVVCLSHGAVTKSGYIQKEIRDALDVADEQPQGTIFLIPLKLEQCEIPDRLRRWQWVNLFEEYGYEKLMRALQVRANELGAAIKSDS